MLRGDLKNRIRETNTESLKRWLSKSKKDLEVYLKNDNKYLYELVEQEADFIEETLNERGVCIK